MGLSQLIDVLIHLLPQALKLGCAQLCSVLGPGCSASWARPVCPHRMLCQSLASVHSPSSELPSTTDTTAGTGRKNGLLQDAQSSPQICLL